MWSVLSFAGAVQCIKLFSLIRYGAPRCGSLVTSCSSMLAQFFIQSSDVNV